ncbi:MAG TPA: 2'-5' RNA ligase family protein [Puia sp.]|jgi:2'-5' RNA ligase|nr:2'-5' RNA ligase family protein [Puia sp.]
METGLVTQSNILSSPLRGQTSAGIGVAGGVVAERGDRRAEYLLVIYPYGELRDRLLEEQQQFSTDYEVTVRNRPHITMAVFQAAEGMEDTLIRWIQRICQRYQRFELTLNNYSGIPPHTTKPAEPACPPGRSLAVCLDSLNPTQRIPGTIYLRVQDPQPFRRLMQQLRAIDHYVRSSGCPPINLIDRPYLSIAGGLTEQVYNRAMPDYSRKIFHESFPVDELVLLKRNHQFDPCRTVNIFRLQPADTSGVSAGTLPHL